MLRRREEFQNGKNTHTVAVFVRVASKGVAAYGTWKSVRKMRGKVKCTAKWKISPD
jgi:hypothetical protein